MGTLDDLLTERQKMQDDVDELRAAIQGIVDAWDGGDLAGAVNFAAGLLPDHFEEIENG